MPSTDIERLTHLLLSRHACVQIATAEEDYALETIRAVVADRRLHLLVWSVTSGISSGDLADEQTVADTAHPAAALTHFATHTPANTVIVMLDLASHLNDPRTLRCLRELLAKLEAVQSTLILLDAEEALPMVISSRSAKLELSLPDAGELDEIVRRTVREMHNRQPVQVQLRKEDLQAMVQNLAGLTRRQARHALIDAMADDQRLDTADIKRIIQYKKRALRGIGVLEAVESFATLDEIGGMTHLKSWLDLRSRSLSQEAIEFGIEPPRGILMLGVQGAGKSLSAKAVATAWHRPLVRLDAGALFDRYIGESERRLRDALRQAEMMAPVILWIDEIEKAFASAASQSNDGGLSKRMFGSLLTWMQEHTRPVFLIATANDVSALPPELLRKGRFDEVFFIDLPTPVARKQIISIHLKKRQRDPELFELDAIVSACEGYSGAEIEAGIKASIYQAFARNCLLSTQMVIEALRASPPLSVIMADKMTALREWAKDRCVPAE